MYFFPFLPFVRPWSLSRQAFCYKNLLSLRDFTTFPVFDMINFKLSNAKNQVLDQILTLSSLDITSPIICWRFDGKRTQDGLLLSSLPCITSLCILHPSAFIMHVNCLKDLRLIEESMERLECLDQTWTWRGCWIRQREVTFQALTLKNSWSAWVNWFDWTKDSSFLPRLTLLCTFDLPWLVLKEPLEYMPPLKVFSSSCCLL